MTPNQAKKIIKAELDKRGIGYTKLRAKTVSFSDLARASCIFVYIDGYGGTKSGVSNAWSEMADIAKTNGFRLGSEGI